MPKHLLPCPLRSISLCPIFLCTLALCALSLGLLSPVTAWAAPASPPDAGAIVEQISQDLDETYIFPQVAREMGQHLEQRLADGAYDDLDLATLSSLLTEDLRSVSHDLHISVFPIPEQEITAGQEVDKALRRARYEADARRNNYGFRKMETLQGNVGYLDLRGFDDASLGGPTAVAAMNYLANADALIIDLRKNGGGSPSMIQLISSYFFDQPQHLNSFYIRRGDRTKQFWTQAHVEGKKMVDTPIWVLTSGRTFSAAEEFTYNLKNMERATIVGQTTGGGAHPVDVHSFPDLGLQMYLPFGRAINPITGSNWEGTGIAPDVEVAAAEALDVAYAQALEHLASKADDPDHRAALDWALSAVQARNYPQQMTSQAMAAYVGVYGPRKIYLEDGVLHYRRGEQAPTALYPMADDLFGLASSDSFRLRFERDADDKVVGLVGLYDDGREQANPRSGDGG